jgi:hypothetical protein
MRLLPTAVLAAGISFVALGLVLALVPVVSALDATIVSSDLATVDGPYVELDSSGLSPGQLSITGHTAVSLTWSANHTVTVRFVGCVLSEGAPPVTCPSNFTEILDQQTGTGGTMYADVPVAETLFAEVPPTQSNASVHVTLRTSADSLGLAVMIGGLALAAIGVWRLRRRRGVGGVSRADARTKP